MADLTVRQGDTLPAFPVTILDQDGDIFDLTGCSVQFVMRAITAATPVVQAAAAVVTASAGRVQYSWGATDTATPGIYACTFPVTTATGGLYTFPNDGYLEVSIEENLTTVGGATLVSLGEARDYLNFQDTDKARDAKLLRFINQITPVVEFITGPIIEKLYDEVYDGGQVFIRLRHRPVMNLLAVSEFRGPAEYALLNIADPAHGDIYTVEIDNGRIVRRSSGGGMVPFPRGLQSIHVVYTAGFASVPGNVTEGTLRLLKMHFQGTQQGRPRMGGSGNITTDDNEPGRDIMGFFVPNSVRELLQPNKRHPSVA